jgi:uncharacterized membrane-anchored protein
MILLPSIMRGATAAAVLLSATLVAEAKTFKELFPDEKITNPKAQEFVDGIDFQQGDVKLGVGGVVLKVTPKFYFLGPIDAKKVLTEAWGNPPVTADGVLGMLLPADKTPIDDTWGAVIRFDSDGYVSDSDAEAINYAEMLTTMQEATAEASAERVKAGFGSLKLVGWASQPYYDKAEKKLHWAKELEFGGEPKHTLNYDVRALGRQGVLKMNFVAGMDDLATIKSIIPAVMAMPEFETGFRYQDYVPGTDKVAAYGVGGLIAGKVLAKAGFLALALAFLKKGWILIFLVLGGLLKGVGRLFRSKQT